MRHSTSKSSLTASESSTLHTTTTASASTLSVDTISEKSKSLPGLPSAGGLSPVPMVQAAAAALMERTPFAIDDAKDDEDESDEDDLEDGGDDDQVMDEVSLDL